MDKACMKPRIVYAPSGIHRSVVAAARRRSGFAVVGNHQGRRSPGAGRGGPLFLLRHGGARQDRLKGADVRGSAYLLLPADTTFEQLRPALGLGSTAKQQQVR